MLLWVTHRFLQERLLRVSVSTHFLPEIEESRLFAIGNLLGIIRVRQFGAWQPMHLAAYFPLAWLIPNRTVRSIAKSWSHREAQHAC